MARSASLLTRTVPLALCALALFGARSMHAQTANPALHGMTGGSAPAAPHGIPRGPAPLQQRIAGADAVALATVEAVGSGRIRFATATPVLGTVPERFEVKQRPSAPLALAVGDRALLLLRGARSPYLALNTGEETLRVADDAAAARWGEAIRAVAAAGEDPANLRPLYVAWSESEDDGLRREAMRALLQPGGPFLPVPQELARERAEAALDPARDLRARRSAVVLAAGDGEALDWMLGRVAADAEATDPDVLEAILRAGLSRGRAGAGTALSAALAAADPERRLGALRVVALAQRRDVEKQLAELAARDPDARVREQAAHWLARVQREAP